MRFVADLGAERHVGLGEDAYRALVALCGACGIDLE